jgi:hypothetical protein
MPLMNVNSIEITGLRFDADLRQHRADVVLLMVDPKTQTEHRVHLHCSAGDQPSAAAETLTERLILDATRQLSWMPEYRLGTDKLAFQDAKVA